MMKPMLLLLVAATLAGCAFGQKHDYLHARPTLDYTGKARLALAVHDQRPYVVSHDKDADFVGLSRAGYGNPYDVSTASGHPLADDMASVLAAALGRSGAEVTMVKVAPGASRAAAVRSLLSTPAEKAVLLSLHEWKSDTYTNSELIYDVEMEILNRRGDVLAKKRAQGTDQLGGSFWNPPAHAREAVPPAFQRKIEDLYFGDIARALNEPDAHASAAEGQHD